MLTLKLFKATSTFCALAKTQTNGLVNVCLLKTSRGCNETIQMVIGEKHLCEDASEPEFDDKSLQKR